MLSNPSIGSWSSWISGPLQSPLDPLQPIQPPQRPSASAAAPIALHRPRPDVMQPVGVGPPPPQLGGGGPRDRDHTSTRLHSETSARTPRVSSGHRAGAGAAATAAVPAERAPSGRPARPDPLRKQASRRPGSPEAVSMAGRPVRGGRRQRPVAAPVPPHAAVPGGPLLLN